jgi:anti-anti-sigma factor
MWVLPDGLPACRGPTIAYMGLLDDVPTPEPVPPRVRADRASAVPGSGARIEVLRAPEELDLATADGLAAQGCAIAGHAGVLLLDLTSLSFCDARGLSAFVRIANQADRAGCRLALIAPQPPVAKVLRICRLDQTLPVFPTTGHALAALTAVPVPA